MGIREWANRHPKQTYVAAGGACAIAVGAIVYQLVSGGQAYPTGLPDAYFSNDDGQTWFVANTSSYPPFDHDGKPAVRAYVFNGGGKTYVGYLERFTAESKKQLDAGKPMTPEMVRFGRELKRPGDAKWTKTGDPAVDYKIQNNVPPGVSPTSLVVLDP